MARVARRHAWLGAFSDAAHKVRAADIQAMMNPWLTLGLLVFWIASVAGAYVKGFDRAQDKARAEYAGHLEKAVADANEDALIDMEAAREAGQREAAVRTKVVTLTNEVERVIREKPAPADCRLQPDTLKLLNVAISIANNADTDSATGVPQPGPKAAPAAKP